MTTTLQPTAAYAYKHVGKCLASSDARSTRIVQLWWYTYCGLKSVTYYKHSSFKRGSFLKTAIETGSFVNPIFLGGVDYGVELNIT